MLIFLNGQFVPEERAVVSVFDRGFLYGDGLFETIRVFNGKPFRWQQHFERLQHGADFLNIILPFSSAALRAFADELILENKMTDALLRLTLSRGIGPRGYSPKRADTPTIVMTLHALPHSSSPSPPRSGGEGRGEVVLRVQQENALLRWKLITSSHRLPANESLAQFKTCNKLVQILARAEADAAGADEALLLNTDGFVVEGASSNLFWIKNGAVHTPPLAAGILPGVTRAVVFEICKMLNLQITESNITPAELAHVDGVFVSLSSFGVVETMLVNGHPCAQLRVVGRIFRSYCELLECENS